MLTIAKGILKGDHRALARAISIVENEDPRKDEILKGIYASTGKAHIVGITGAPGSGKSSLVSALLHVVRQEVKNIGVIAVDPSSPFTGGAILGDRIRMQEHFQDKDIFIRSMGSRGSLGGLSRATRDTVKLLDAFGKKLIIIETVGVGQSEVDIMENADTVIVVLTPGSGDGIQIIKAGIMEIADVFVVNKADLPDASRMDTEINIMLDMGEEKEWRPPVVQTVALEGLGVNDLWDRIKEHRCMLEEKGLLEKIRKERMKKEALECIDYQVKEMFWGRIGKTTMFKNGLSKVYNKEIDPLSLAHSILKIVDFNLTDKYRK